MHLITGISTAQMREAGAGNPETRRFRMIDRCQEPAFGSNPFVIECGIFQMPIRLSLEAVAIGNGDLGQIIDPLDAMQLPEAAVHDGADAAPSGLIQELNEAHDFLADPVSRCLRPSHPAAIDDELLG